MELEELLNEIKNRNGFPAEAYITKVREIFDNISQNYSTFVEEHKKRLREEPLEERISQLFEGKVGPKYNDTRIEEIHKEGEKRLENDVPPVSQKDRQKKEPYGDLIGWFQIIDYAKENGKSVILVTDDKDWRANKGKVPHTQLRKEMQDKVGTSFYIYKLELFTKHAKEHLKSEISEHAIEEVENRERYVEQQQKLSHYNPLYPQSVRDLVNNINAVAKQYNQVASTSINALSMYKQLDDSIKRIIQNTPTLTSED